MEKKKSKNYQKFFTTELNILNKFQMAQNKNTTIDPAIIEAMDDILNNRSKLAEKIIDVLNNDVKNTK